MIWEEDGFFDELLRETPYFVLGMCWYDDHDEWIEKIFPVGPEAMEQYVLSAAVSERTGKAEGLLPLEWEIEFPANMIRVE